MSITKKFFGKTKNNTDVYMYTLKNSNGMEADVINFGGIIVSLRVPDRTGKLCDVVLGYDNLESYEKDKNHFGAIIGRHANRIEGAEFEINGIKYNVAKNEGSNHIHGGVEGFDKKVWSGKAVQEDGKESLELSYLSADGEEGYPGNLNVRVYYSLTDDNAIHIHYYAVSDKDTVVNLTNHSYFNLTGEGSQNILDEKLMVNADKFTANDKCSLPTGEIRSVADTPLDFKKFTKIGERISSNYDQIVFGGGYDHNWILNSARDISKKAAEVVDEKSGIGMETYTTMPGLQIYTANFLDGTMSGKGGITYESRDAICLESQYFPNAMKHKNFPSPVLRAGSVYDSETVYKFNVLK